MTHTPNALTITVLNAEQPGFEPPPRPLSHTPNALTITVFNAEQPGFEEPAQRHDYYTNRVYSSCGIDCRTAYVV